MYIYCCFFSFGRRILKRFGSFSSVGGRTLVMYPHIRGHIEKSPVNNSNSYNNNNNTNYSTMLLTVIPIMFISDFNTSSIFMFIHYIYFPPNTCRCFLKILTNFGVHKLNLSIKYIDGHRWDSNIKILWHNINIELSLLVLSLLLLLNLLIHYFSMTHSSGLFINGDSDCCLLYISIYR